MAMGEVVAVRHKNVTDELRMINKNDVLSAKAKTGDIAKLASQLFEIGKRIFSEPQKSAAGKSPFGTRWKANHRGLGGVFLLTQPVMSQDNQINCWHEKMRIGPGTVSQCGTT
jgi:hypothetical protein